MENGAGVGKGAAAAAPVAATAVREQDRLMPIANVTRIMRRMLPPHAKISDDAKELIQDCVSEFISFVTGEANERCHAEHRKTVTAEDVVWAMDNLGFDDYVMPLTAFLQRMHGCEARVGAVARAPSSAQHMATAPGNGVQVQMHRAVYAPPGPAQEYAVAMEPLVQATVVSPHIVGGQGQQGDVLCTEHAVTRQYLGNGAYGGSSSRGVCGDEESSSSGAPVPATGTALSDPQ
ncbi:nuclear transcription factor Y subunit B-9 [Lolium perenne]|jgi:histone H3/H4|uniref:nuclear transcription factor Y subunit B-9 n=1 Tax=Lolium perenne TaxID=4522 RepID=UPI0021EA4789|nr:nuclear transcription factor Y subunit B-8-like [Lolium perenne]